MTWRSVFNRAQARERLIKAAAAARLECDGESIWSADEPAVRYLIEPDLMDRLAVIYQNDGHLVYGGGTLVEQSKPAEDRLQRAAMTVEDYLEAREVGAEPRIRYDSGPKSDGWESA